MVSGSSVRPFLSIVRFRIPVRRFNLAILCETEQRVKNYPMFSLLESLSRVTERYMRPLEDICAGKKRPIMEANYSACLVRRSGLAYEFNVTLT